MKKLLLLLLLLLLSASCSSPDQIQEPELVCEDVVNFYDIYSETTPGLWSTTDALQWFSDYNLWVILRGDAGEVIFRGFQSEIDVTQFVDGQIVQFYAWFGEPDLGINHETLEGCYITKCWTQYIE